MKLTPAMTQAALKLQRVMRFWHQRRAYIQTLLKMPRMAIVKDIKVSPACVPASFQPQTKSGLASIRMYITGVNVLEDLKLIAELNTSKKRAQLYQHPQRAKSVSVASTNNVLVSESF